MARAKTDYKTREKERIKTSPKRMTGASRVAPRKKIGEKFQGILRVLKLFFVSLIVAAGLWSVIHLEPLEKLKKMTHKPIYSVQIDGEFLYLSKEKAQNLVSSFIEDGRLKADLITIKNELEKNPWVDSVALSRKWPNTLKVHVSEQQPIARWGTKGFLNMKGDLIEVAQNQNLDELPLLSGEDRYAEEVMQQYLHYGKLLSQMGLNLASIELSNTKNWLVELDSGLLIKLGKDRTFEKLKQIKIAKDTVLSEDFDKVQAIDMRYHSGFAIEWRSVGEAQVAMNEKNINKSL